MDPLQPLDPSEGYEIPPTIRVHDLGRAELVDRLDADDHLKHVRYWLGQCFPRIPVHAGDQIQEATAHGQMGDVDALDLVGPIDPQASQQVGGKPYAPSQLSSYRASGRLASAARYACSSEFGPRSAGDKSSAERGKTRFRGITCRSWPYGQDLWPSYS